MSKWIIPFLVVILCLVASCGSNPTPEPTATAVPTDTPVPSPTATPSPVPPTATSTLTATPEPTSPPAPEGMDVEVLDPVHYAARIKTPGVNIRSEAKADSEVLAKYECGADPLTLDAAASGGADGQLWYHIAAGGWIREDVIEVYADLETAASAAKSAKCQGSGSQNTEDYTPTKSSVWNTTIGPDNMTGTCSGGSFLPVYGLVQIIPAGETLTWRSQEPAPYTFSRVKLNVYSYSGPTALNDGTVTMTLTFTSATTLQMTHLYVPTADATCQHTHQYNGVFQWFN